MAPPNSRNAANLQELRLRSRQDYLAKREEEQLALLRKQVAEEAEEERSNPHLSQREKEEFRINRETLRLAEERLSISDHVDGFVIPGADLVDDKKAVLNRKHNDKYVSEWQQFEDEQTKAARGWAGKSAESVREQDYEFVFDESQAIKWNADAASRLDPDKLQLQQMLDAAEKKAQSIDEVRKSLPMYQYRDSLLAAIEEHSVLVLVGETGSGKTTQLPQYLYETNAHKGKKIACTQPRRVAAMSVAARVSEEMGCKLGTTVGYNVRFDQRTQPDTTLEYMTDGMLLQLLLGDPALSDYSVLMIDEAHERSLHTDIILAIAKDLVKFRPDFKIIVASATVNAQAFSGYFMDCPIFSVPGRRYPVDILYTSQPEANYLAAASSTIFQIHVSQPLGDILVFLTGEEEISSLCENLESTAKKLGSRIPELLVRPIYANLPSSEQQKIFAPTPPNSRKVVVATNIAETSLTIDGIVYVIDSGFSKINQYNPKSGMESLVVTPCSRANANQRAGRAGRVGPGKCFRLYTKWAFYNELEAEPQPEIQRTNITSVVLLLKSLGINDLINFDFFSPPSTNALIKALEDLYALGALNEQGQLTRIGRKMADIPVAPDLARVILAADEFGCVEEILSIVAMLQESAALFMRPKDKKLHADAARNRFTSKEGGDFLTLLNVWNQWVDSDYDPNWATQEYLQPRVLNRARDVRDQLVRLCERVEVELSSNPDHIAIRKAFCRGFFAKAARLSRGGDSYRTAHGGLTTYLHPSSTLMESRPKWVVFFELVLTSKEYMRNSFPLDDPGWLLEAAPHAYKKEDLEKLGWDKKVGKTRTETRTEVKIHMH